MGHRATCMASPVQVTRWPTLVDAKLPSISLHGSDECGASCCVPSGRAQFAQEGSQVPAPQAPWSSWSRMPGRFRPTDGGSLGELSR